MYINIDKSYLPIPFPLWGGIDRNGQKDFIFDIGCWRIWINFSLRRWSFWKD